VVNDSSTSGKPGSARWFDSYARNASSQGGEDGILERIFELIPGAERWCCEFGAWDGRKYSNTYELIANKGWSGVLIEADPAKFEDLKRTYAGNSKVVLLNRFVEFEGAGLLDTLLAGAPAPLDLDLLSIDIDGNDYHVWASVRRYRPKVVIIEYNQSIPNHVEFVQAADPEACHGNSLLSLTNLAAEKGYQLVAVTDTNAIYVREEYFHLFGIRDNSLTAMRPVAPYVTDLFQLYDGTVVLSGYRQMIWHNVAMPAARFQVVPRYLRTFPGVMGALKLFLFRVWRFLYRWRDRS
jgi:hypothetical protein